jgi:beta propeller domain-containing protein
MKRILAVAISAVVMVLGLVGCASEAALNVVPQTPSAPTVTPKTMRPFHSDTELSAYLREVAAKQRRVMRKGAALVSGAAPANFPMSLAVAGLASADAKEESITNVQHAGVDEGGIVKVHGNYLVVLRRGRLFTVSIDDGDLRPVSSADAFGPEIDPRSTWYDELLISKDIVAVIGYSYERGGTEVGLFQIDDGGKLTYRSTYQLRSNDYYSSRNYASRLIGSKLIFYAPLYLNPVDGDLLHWFPAVRKWHKGAGPGEFRRIVAAAQVYKPETLLDSPDGTALHTVTVCDLASADFDCKATSVIGPPGRVFYVSPHAVYIWVTSWNYGEKGAVPKSMLYRMPLDGSAPSALKVSGSPVDQFSFLESDDGYLNVLVRSESVGDGMWGAETAAGSIALMRMPLGSFSDGSVTVPTTSYLRLPTPRGYAFENRFVGKYLLYGAGSGWGYPQKKQHSQLFAVRWANGDLNVVAMEHGTDRIEAMGSDAVVVGTDGRDLHFTAVRLGDVPEAVDDYVEKGASQGELRSHGFFYKAEAADSGMLGLPISVPLRAGYQHLFATSAAIVFLKNDALHFEEMGDLGADPKEAKDDGCRASCVDWYGNSQPLFLHGRIIALLGYEMVEGAMEKGRIYETRRVNYGSNLTVSRR